MPLQDGVHGRGGDTERPADHVRTLAQLFAGAQDRLLDRVGSPSRGAVWAARAVAQWLTRTQPVDPLRCRLPRAADHERSGCDRDSGCDEITDTLTLANGQDRICMKIHKSPPSVATRTSRTLGGLVATSRRQQRVWELQLRSAVSEHDLFGVAYPSSACSTSSSPRSSCATTPSAERRSSASCRPRCSAPASSSSPVCWRGERRSRSGSSP